MSGVVPKWDKVDLLVKLGIRTRGVIRNGNPRILTQAARNVANATPLNRTQTSRLRGCRGQVAGTALPANAFGGEGFCRRPAHIRRRDRRWFTWTTISWTSRMDRSCKPPAINETLRTTSSRSTGSNHGWSTPRRQAPPAQDEDQRARPAGCARPARQTLHLRIAEPPRSAWCGTWLVQGQLDQPRIAEKAGSLNPR